MTISTISQAINNGTKVNSYTPSHVLLAGSAFVGNLLVITAGIRTASAVNLVPPPGFTKLGADINVGINTLSIAWRLSDGTENSKTLQWAGTTPSNTLMWDTSFTAFGGTYYDLSSFSAIENVTGGASANSVPGTAIVVPAGSRAYSYPFARPTVDTNNPYPMTLTGGGSLSQLTGNPFTTAHAVALGFGTWTPTVSFSNSCSDRILRAFLLTEAPIPKSNLSLLLCEA